MTEQNANKLAYIVNGEAWNSGGDIWLVIVSLANGGLVVYSDEIIARYRSQDDFDNGVPESFCYINQEFIMP